MAKKKKVQSDKVRQSKARNKFRNTKTLVQSNPFEVKINKQKHKILGRKSKHDRGLPGVSRSKSFKKRKETLLHEYKQLNKANQIKDERLGVNDKQLSLEEKMLQRFALEKKKKHEKLTQFNLNDEEELTHLGQSLSTITNFDNPAEESDEDDTGEIGAEYVEEAHFGGGMFTKKSEEGGFLKSRKELMQEIIANSKTAKFERQTEKEKSDQLVNKLDDTWSEVRELLKSSSRTLLDKEFDKQRTKTDDYDTVMREMIFDRTATPGQRKKTDEEIAREREAEVRKHEEERLARMKNDMADKRPKHQSADALCDEFAVPKSRDAIPILAYPINADPPSDGENEDGDTFPDVVDAENVDSETVDQGIVDDGASLDEEEDDESDDYSDIDSGNEDDGDLASLAEDLEIEQPEEEKPKNKEKSKSSFPASYAEFTALLSSGMSAAELTQKLRTDFAPDLGKGNKARMIELFAYAWEHSCRMAAMSPPNVKVLNSLCSHLYELCQLNLDSCSHCVVERLKRSYLYCFMSRKSKKPRWPKFEMLMQFKMIKMFYSTSDFSHSVATRSLLFICSVLNNCRITRLKDLTCGLFLCTLACEYVCFSKRFIPECLNFLLTCISTAIPLNQQVKSRLPHIVSLHLDRNNCNLLASKEQFKWTSENFEKLNLVQILDDAADPEPTDQLRHSLLVTALRLSQKFAQIYSEFPTYKEIFSPFEHLCNWFTDDQCADASPLVKELATKIMNVLQENYSKPKKRLNFGPKRPKLLRLYDPKIQYVGEPFDKISRNVSADKREKDRLVHKQRREMKGAVREIRKDARFIARQRQKEQEDKDAERAEKVKRLYGLLANQEGDVKKIKRSKYALDL